MKNGIFNGHGRLCGAVATISLLTLAGPACSATCHRRDLSENLRWVTSGVTSVTDDGSVLVIDSMAKRANFFQIDLLGQVTPLVFYKTAPTPEIPLRIRPSNGGYLVHDQAPGVNAFLRLKGREFSKQRVGIGGRKAAAGEESTVIFEWAHLSSGEFVFGDVQLDDGHWRMAFAFHGADGGLEVYDSFDISHPARLLYLRNWRYVAALNGRTAYALFLDEDPSNHETLNASIGKFEVGKDEIQRLGMIPEDYRPAPRLQREAHLHGAAQATLFYQTIERNRMSAGLYAHDGNLFLLAKDPISEERETAWWLFKLDPESGAEIARALLPTKAAHLTVIPGEKWFFIEKDMVEPVGELGAPYMRTDSMVVVPNEWLANPKKGPLADEDLSFSCGD